MDSPASVTVFTNDFPTHQKLRPRLPAFARVSTPPPMQLTERDKRILETIHAFDDVLADYQIRRLFFKGTSQMYLRTSLLYQHGYVARPNRRQRAMLPSMIYWLDTKGAECVAGLSGMALKEFVYRREPKWAQIEHDLAVNDFRLDLMEACALLKQVALEEWIGQNIFWAHPDRVEFTDSNGQARHRLVRPDGYAVITLAGKQFRLLIEIDRATEDNPRFGREKVLPGIAYLRSDIYRRRFGYNAGKWLVVTTGERRMQNMKRQTERTAGKDAQVFYFTTFAQVTPQSLLTAPIWWRGGSSVPTALFTL